MASWNVTQQAIGDKHAVRIRRAFLDRIRRTVSRTSWSLVEEMIPYGAMAVYNAIQWVEWMAGEQMAPAYREMYKKSQVELQKVVVKKASPSIVVNENSFTMANPEAEAWLYNFSAKEVKGITTQELDSVRAILANGQMNKQTYKKTAAQLRETVGLTEGQAKAVVNYELNLRKNGVSEARIKQLADKYSNKLLKYRAETIALTESHTATNKAWSDSVVMANYMGDLPSDKFEMRWLVAADERLCERCQAMSGSTSSIEAQSFRGMGIPPLHPRCRCVTIVQRIKAAPKTPIPQEPPELRALKSYVGEGYKEINENLRKGIAPTDVVLQLDALEAVSKLPENVVVYRGVSSKAIAGIENLNGAIITDPAFISTSSDKVIAQHFLGSAVASGTEGVLFEIHLPKGANAIRVLDHLRGVIPDREKEYILPRGTQLKVEKVRRMRIGDITVKNLILEPVIAKSDSDNKVSGVRIDYNKFIDNGVGLIIDLPEA